MKRTVSARSTEPGARVRRLSIGQLERVMAGLAYPQIDGVQSHLADYPDPQDLVVTRPAR